MDGYTHHAQQRMAQRAVDANEVARALCGELVHQQGALQRWYARGVTVLVDTYRQTLVTVYREIRPEPQTRRRR